VRFLRGWFLGDGTGAGKGRQVAAIILDNWLKGRRRPVWISKSDKLIEDAERGCWSAVGGYRSDIVPLPPGCGDRARGRNPLHHLCDAPHPGARREGKPHPAESSISLATVTPSDGSPTRPSNAANRSPSRPNGPRAPWNGSPRKTNQPDHRGGQVLNPSSPDQPRRMEPQGRRQIPVSTLFSSDQISGWPGTKRPSSAHGQGAEAVERVVYKRVLSQGGPRVRIPLPPPASLSLDRNLSLVAQSPRVCGAAGGVLPAESP